MPGKRSKRSSFDTDEEEVPQIIRNENDSVEESGSPKRRTCCTPLMIILLVVIVLAAAGFLVYYFVFSPTDETGKSIPTAPTPPSPTPLPPTPNDPSLKLLLENVCSEDHTEGAMQSVLTLDEPVVLMEFFDFSDSNEEVAFGLYEQLLEDEAEILFQMELPDWDVGLYTQFDDGAALKDFLEDNESILEQRKQISKSELYATTLSPDVPNLYPELIGPTGSPNRLLLHGIKFTKPNGRDMVASFDQDTKEIKSKYNYFTLGWFNVAATCIGESDDTMDQYRLESIQSIAEYSQIFSEDIWVPASKQRTDGTDLSVSYTDFVSKWSTISNMYN